MDKEQGQEGVETLSVSREKFTRTTTSHNVYWTFYIIYNIYYSMYTSFIHLTYIQHIHKLDYIVCT
jgi:hypothetical protein